MRTTLNLDPEALAKARLLSKQRGVPMGKVVSEIILKSTEQKGKATIRNGVPVFVKQQGPAPDLDLVNKLREE